MYVILHVEHSISLSLLLAPPLLVLDQPHTKCDILNDSIGCDLQFDSLALA